MTWWYDINRDEQARIVKTFCDLHDSGDFTVSEIAKKLGITREDAGLLCTLKHYYDN